MATVLRVRRKRTTDPAESLVFALNKKARTTSEGDTAADVGSGGGAASKSSGAAGVSPSSPSSPTGDGKKVFKFAGTVGRKDDPIAHQIEDAIKKSTQNTTITSSKPSKSSSKSKSSKSKSKARDKCRSAQQQSAHARRYAVITSLRGIDLNELDTESKNPTPKKTAPVKRTPSKLKIWNRLSKEKKAAAAAAETADEEMAKKLFCLYDVVQEDASATATTNGQSQAKTADKKGAANPDVILCNSVQMIREKLVIDDKSPETDYVYDLYYIEEGPVDLNAATIGMHTGPDQELIYEHFVEQEQFEMYEDDSDSNEEGNWRNDYPEDEPDKRHPDLFDELIDDYCYGDQSSDDDFGEYSDYKKRPGRNMLNYNDDDLDCYS